MTEHNREKDVAVARSRLSQAKLALLEKKLKGASANGQLSGQAVLDARQRPTPLAKAEAEIWTYQQLNPQSNAFNITVPARIRGRLNVGALWRGFNSALTARGFAALGFAVLEGKAVQIISRGSAICPSIADISGLAGAAQLAEIEKIKTEDFNQPYDVTNGEVIRAKIITISDDECVLLTSLHGLVADCEAAVAFVRETFLHYEALVECSTSRSDGSKAKALPACNSKSAASVQGSDDLAVAPGLRPQRSSLAAGLAFSNQTLLSRRPPSQRTALVLKKSVVELLGRLAEREKVTKPVVLLSALVGWLNADSKGEQAIRLTPTDRRREPVTDNERSASIEVRFHGQMDFRALMRRISESILNPQHPPNGQIEALINVAAPTSAGGKHQALQALFRFQEPRQPITVGGVTIGLEMVIAGTELSDLALDLSEREGEIAVNFSHNAELLDDDETRRFIEGFEVWLTELIKKPDGFSFSFLAETNWTLRAMGDLQRAEGRKASNGRRDPPATMDSVLRSPLEQKIAECIERSFRLQGLGTDDNFLKFVGAYAQLLDFHHWLNTSFGVGLPLLTLIETPTISQLSLAVVKRQIEQSNPVLTDQLMDQVEQLSEEEAQWMVTSEWEALANQRQ